MFKEDAKRFASNLHSSTKEYLLSTIWVYEAHGLRQGERRLPTSDKACSVLSGQMPALILRSISRNAMRYQSFFDELTAVIRHHASMLISAVLMIITPNPRGASLHLPAGLILSSLP